MATWLDTLLRPFRRTLVAATTLSERRRRRNPETGEATVEGRITPAWTVAAWHQYNTCGELRFVVRWEANAGSLARLYAGKVADPGQPATPLPKEHQASVELAGLADGPAGQRKMLREMIPQVVVAGDSTLILWEQDGRREWAVRSNREVTETADLVTVRMPSSDGGVNLELPASTTVTVPIRDVHPERCTEPDSPVRPLIKPLQIIEWCDRVLYALTRSRLRISKLLLLDDGMNFPGRQSTVAGKPPVRTPDTFWDDLLDGLMEWIDDPDDASVGVPYILTGKGEKILNSKLIDFSGDDMEKLLQLQDKAIQRVARGLNIPPEILMGLGESSHWNAWMIDEMGVRTTIQPILDLICECLTLNWLRPALRAAAGADFTEEELAEIVVSYDLTALTTRPDQGKEATEAYDRIEISGEAYRRKLGIAEKDKPSDEEVGERLGRDMAKRITPDPEIARAIISEYGVLDNPVDDAPPVARPVGIMRPQTPAAPPAPPAEPAAPRQEASRGAPGTGTPPATNGTRENGRAVVAHAMVAHALQYAGQRFMKGLGRSVHRLGAKPEELYLHRAVPVEAIDGLMEGCWNGHWQVLPQELIAAADRHVRDLLLHSQPYDPTSPPPFGLQG